VLVKKTGRRSRYVGTKKKARGGAVGEELPIRVKGGRCPKWGGGCGKKLKAGDGNGFLYVIRGKKRKSLKLVGKGERFFGRGGRKASLRSGPAKEQRESNP